MTALLGSRGNMKISELSKATNVSIRMIRYYEEKGLLRPERTDSGYRRFKQEDIELINRIRMFKEIGFTIEDVIPIIECQLVDSDTAQICDKLKEKFSAKIKQIDSSITHLESLKAILAGYL